MDKAKLQAWWWTKQGLDGSLLGKTSREALLRSGWARSVGGANPYMTVFSRTGQSRETIDSDVAALRIHELPSARGCTYVLPEDDFGLALSLAKGQGEGQEIAMAKKFLGVTDAELEKLRDATLLALEKGAMDPKQIKDEVGDAARSLGEEGKKRGATSTLPMVLGRLQVEGLIGRVPQDGRLDRQRYKYVLWKNPPVQLPYDEALRCLAEKYFRWIGPASVAHFQWFSGLSQKAAKEALAHLDLVELGDEGLLILKNELDSFQGFQAPEEPTYALVASLDAIMGHRREVASLLGEDDHGRETITEKGLVRIYSVVDLYCNAIIDRGRLVGLWEYDPEAQEIVYEPFNEDNADLRAAVRQSERFIREQVGDCRSFSLDSPESRKPKLALLREMASQKLASSFS